MNEPVPLAFDGVTLAFGTRTVLGSISAVIPARSRTIISGENGAGKTSLLKIALGLIAPTSGTVALFGLSPRSSRWRSVRRRAAYVHQGAIKIEFPISAREVVAIGTSARSIPARERARVIDEAMARTGCLALAERPYRVLSGGEKQKVSIARCLCQEPSLLLLDEPCSSLDPQASEEILALLEGLPEEVTIVMVSHVAEHYERSGWRTLALSEGVHA